MTLALAPLSSACTLVGLGVGGLTPREENVAPGPNHRFTTRPRELPEVDEWVEIELGDGRMLEGFYRGVQHGAFVVQTERGVRPAPLDEVREFRVVRGTHAAEGAAIGIFLDLSVALFLQGGRL